MFIFLFLALFTTASAQFDRTALLVNVPTADVLPRGSLAVTALLTQPLFTTPRNPDREGGGAVRFSPLGRLELALTAYTPQDWVLGASYQVLGGMRRRTGTLQLRDTLAIEGVEEAAGIATGPSLAVGIHDVGIHAYVSPIGNGPDDAWPDWKYGEYRPWPTVRQPENFSAFVVGTLPLGTFARVHLGLGRGRYVGYDRGRFLNTDIFLDETHWWAVSLFGGIELLLGPYARAGVEADGRDVNAGLRVDAGQFNISVAVTKLEGFTPTLTKDRFGRVALAFGYQFNNLLPR
ncbi:MAG: hypothetical protein R6X12_04570 [bacterium]